MTEDDLVGWHHRHCQWTWVWVNSGSWWWTGRPGVLQSMGSQSWTRLSNWTELKALKIMVSQELPTDSGEDICWDLGTGVKQDLWSKASSFPEMNYKNSNYSVLWIITYNLWMRWRRKSQPTPVFLPGKSHGRRSLVGYSLWGRKELDTTEWVTICIVNFMRQLDWVMGCPDIWLNIKVRFAIQIVFIQLALLIFLYGFSLLHNN